MPSKALQSLIDTFETSQTPTNPPLKPTVIPTKATQNGDHTPPRSNHSLLESPSSPTASSLASFAPIQPSLSSRSASPSTIGGTPSIIDAQDLDFLDASVTSKSKEPDSKHLPIPSVSVKKAPPPLPPRRNDSDPPATSSSSLGDSLIVKHSYPPVRKETGHIPSSSISSFHSISLSSDGGNRESMNMDDSIEFLSIPSIPPTPAPPPNASAATPKLPPRPASTPAAYQPRRRAPPPPPPTFPKRKSSAAAPSSSKDSTAREPVVEPAAQDRYGSLFDRNLEAQKKRKERTTQAKGWKATSTAFLKAPPIPPPSKRLEGHIVKAIWECSQLNKYQLRRIW
jgi:hypothetical protein